MLNNEPQTPLDMMLILMYAPLTIGIPFVIDYWFLVMKDISYHD